jgi:hypothetical protein
MESSVVQAGDQRDRKDRREQKAQQDAVPTLGALADDSAADDEDLRIDPPKIEGRYALPLHVGN